MLTSLLLFQMKWTECLQGAGFLRECLTDLAELSGARVVHLHRTCTRLDLQRTIASVDRDARGRARRLTSGIGQTILASANARARPGTVWTLGELDNTVRDDMDERCAQWLADRQIREVAAIPLDRSGTEIDVLELYFTARLPADLLTTLEVLAAVASVAWLRREKGRIARVLTGAPATAERLSQKMLPERASPLSPSNPYGLTAAETRICGIVQSGYCTTTEIIQHLQVSEPTLRTHLRNIYAKTGMRGQVELVHVLLGEQGAAYRLDEAG